MVPKKFVTGFSDRIASPQRLMSSFCRGAALVPKCINSLFLPRIRARVMPAWLKRRFTSALGFSAPGSRLNCKLNNRSSFRADNVKKPLDASLRMMSRWAVITVTTLINSIAMKIKMAMLMAILVFSPRANKMILKLSSLKRH